jgi:hypothetical protein
MDSPIPLIDFSTSQTSEQLAEQVLLAFTSVGFLHVAGLPGLDKEAIANAFSIVRLLALFSAPSLTLATAQGALRLAHRRAPFVPTRFRDSQRASAVQGHVTGREGRGS